MRDCLEVTRNFALRLRGTVVILITVIIYVFYTISEYMYSI